MAYNKSHSKRKAEQLGMSHGAAAGRLRKQIMFRLLQEAGEDVCYRCSKQIETADEMSIEHIVPWLNSDNPKELFFDLNNIAFSHLSCNVRESNRKLTDEDVITIRKRLANGEPKRDIAKDFPVTQRTIVDINNGRSWKH